MPRIVFISRAMRLVRFLPFIAVAAHTAHAQSISVGAGDSARVDDAMVCMQANQESQTFGSHMYPFRDWSYGDVVSRLHALQSAGFEVESVIAAAQTIEQGLKRCLVRQMNRQQAGARKRDDQGTLVPLETRVDRDTRIRWLSGLPAISEAWRGLFGSADTSGLAALVDDIAGSGAWIEQLGGPARLDGRLERAAIGLFPLRHRLVHGWHSPSRVDIANGAHAGARLVTLLFDPSSGIASRTGYDPFTRMPRWQSPPTAPPP
jgi:hypothetical protein